MDYYNIFKTIYPYSTIFYSTSHEIYTVTIDTENILFLSTKDINDHIHYRLTVLISKLLNIQKDQIVFDLTFPRYIRINIDGKFYGVKLINDNLNNIENEIESMLQVLKENKNSQYVIFPSQENSVHKFIDLFKSSFRNNKIICGIGVTNDGKCWELQNNSARCYYLEKDTIITDCIDGWSYKYDGKQMIRWFSPQRSFVICSNIGDCDISQFRTLTQIISRDGMCYFIQDGMYHSYYNLPNNTVLEGENQKYVVLNSKVLEIEKLKYVVSNSTNLFETYQSCIDVVIDLAGKVTTKYGPLNIQGRLQIVDAYTQNTYDVFFNSSCRLVNQVEEIYHYIRCDADIDKYFISNFGKVQKVVTHNGRVISIFEENVVQKPFIFINKLDGRRYKIIDRKVVEATYFLCDDEIKNSSYEKCVDKLLKENVDFLVIQPNTLFSKQNTIYLEENTVFLDEGTKKVMIVTNKNIRPITEGVTMINDNNNITIGSNINVQECLKNKISIGKESKIESKCTDEIKSKTIEERLESIENYLKTINDHLLSLIQK